MSVAQTPYTHTHDTDIGTDIDTDTDTDFGPGNALTCLGVYSEGGLGVSSNRFRISQPTQLFGGLLWSLESGVLQPGGRESRATDF